MARPDTDRSSKRQRIQDMINANEIEISAAEETAKRYREKHCELRRLLNDTTAATSVLPREILAEIFLEASFQESFSDSKVHKRPPQEFIVARVCKEWREIAWTTPRLWCRIDIAFRRGRYETQKRLIEEWIERSGDYPLEIRISVRPYSFGLPWDPPIGTFDSIIQSCSRWKTFICSALWSLSMALQQDTTLRFSSLETLILEPERNRDLALKVPLEGLNFHFPPLLKHLDIMEVRRDRFAAVNWSALTQLRVDILLGPEWVDFENGISLEVLKSCQSLVDLNCGLKTQISDPNHVFSPTIIRFPFLQSLSIVPALPCTITQFMDMTELPALTTLEVCADDISTMPEDPSWTTALVDWAKRSSFRLECLKISTNNLVEDRYIADMIRQFSPPQPMKTLCIYTRGNPNFLLSDALLEQLTIKRRGTIENCLPRLTLFSFDGNISFTTSAMIAMLNSRRGLATEGLSSDDDHDDEHDHDDDDDREHDHDDSGYENESSIETEELPSDLSTIPFAIKIDYNNRDWLQKQKPNKMREFYQAVEEFDTNGRTFHLQWNGFDSDDDEIYEM